MQAPVDGVTHPEMESTIHRALPGSGPRKCSHREEVLWVVFELLKKNIVIGRA